MRGDFESQLPVTTQRFEDFLKAHKSEHDLIEKSVLRAREVVDYRLEAMNELREQINSERGSFVSRAMFDELAKRLNTIENGQAAANKMIMAWVTAFGLLIAVIQVMLHFFATKQ